MPSGAADAAPCPFFDSVFYREIRSGCLQAASARNHHKLDSLRPNLNLSEACADPDHWQHMEAQAILKAWRPTFNVVSRPASDPLWQNHGWQLAINITQGRNKNGQQTEPIQGSTGDLICDMAQFRSKVDNAEHKASRFAALDHIGMDNSHDPTVAATPEAKEKFAFLLPDKKKQIEEVEPQQEQSAVVEEEPEFKRQFDALGYLELARKHPNLTVQEREVLAKGVVRYGTYVAKRTERVLVAAGYVEEAANGFALHALQLMDRGRYEDRGIFRGWLSKVWRNYHWQAHTEKAARQRSTEVGLQTWDVEEGDDGRAEAGRVRLDVVFSQTTNHDADAEDYVTQSLTERLEKLRPLLTLEERRILQRKLDGSTHAEVAAHELICTDTVRERLRGITAKANGVLLESTAREPFSVQACCNMPEARERDSSKSSISEFAEIHGANRW